MHSWDAEYSDPQLMTGGVKVQPSVVRLLKQLKKRGGVDLQNATAIDFGCGTGRAAIELAQRGAHVYAFDAARVAIEQAKKYAEANHITFEHHAWGAQSVLPQAESSVDVILANMVLHLLDAAARTQVASEMLRVLKPGGCVVVRTLAREGDANAKKLIAQFPAPNDANAYLLPELGHAEHVFAREELLQLFHAEPGMQSVESTAVFMQKTSAYPRMGSRVFKRNYWEMIVQKHPEIAHANR